MDDSTGRAFEEQQVERRRRGFTGAYFSVYLRSFIE
jgi:hypothetical protein